MRKPRGKEYEIPIIPFKGPVLAASVYGSLASGNRGIWIYLCHKTMCCEQGTSSYRTDTHNRI